MINSEIKKQVNDQVANINFQKIYEKRHLWWNRFKAHENKEFFVEEIDINLITQKSRSFINSMALSHKAEKVRVRKNGITSFGIAHWCHWNVAMTVARFGGRKVYGYAVSQSVDGYVCIFYHSVWETPEGKLVCLSNKDFSNDDYIYFFKLRSCDFNEEIGHDVRHIVFYFDKDDVFIDTYSNGVIKTNFKFIKKFNLYQKEIKINHENYLETNDWKSFIEEINRLNLIVNTGEKNIVLN